MALSLTGIETKAQTVTNINVEVYGNKVIVNYNLDKTTDIDLYVSADGGTTWEGPLKQVSGNVGKNVQPGSNSIIWDAIKERGGISGDDIVFDIRTPRSVEFVAAEYSNKSGGYVPIRITKATKTGDHYVIEYSLDKNASAVGLYYSEDQGETWKGPVKKVTGNILNVLAGSNKKLEWRYKDEIGSRDILPIVKLEIMEKGSISKTDRKSYRLQNAAKQYPDLYVYDNNDLFRKRDINKWFVLPELGWGIDTGNASNLITMNVTFVYQIIRPFGIGGEIGFHKGVSWLLRKTLGIPLTINVVGWLSEKKVCAFYNVGIGVTIPVSSSDPEEEWHVLTTYKLSGVTFNAEFGVAIRNITIGAYLQFMGNYCYSSKYGKVSGACPGVKFGYNLPLKKK